MAMIWLGCDRPQALKEFHGYCRLEGNYPGKGEDSPVVTTSLMLFFLVPFLLLRSRSFSSSSFG